jgi:large subunit ribosomal protein L35
VDHFGLKSWFLKQLSGSTKGEKMPKMKTHSGAKKRFKLTKSGKVKRSAASKRHHAWAKSSASQKLKLRKTRYVSKADQDNIKRLIPYA